jgi:hypothetical protein
MEVSGQLLSPAALPPGENPRYPIDMRLDGPRRRSGHSLLLPGIEPRLSSPWFDSACLLMNIRRNAYKCILTDVSTTCSQGQWLHVQYRNWWWKLLPSFRSWNDRVSIPDTGGVLSLCLHCAQNGSGASSTPHPTDNGGFPLQLNWLEREADHLASFHVKIWNARRKYVFRVTAMLVSFYGQKLPSQNSAHPSLLCRMVLNTGSRKWREKFR